jgi:hypothetical protein
LNQSALVKKGYFLQLTQITAKIAIDTTGNASSSDLQWSTNIWSKLNSNSNWRFYLDTLNNFTSYQNTINVVYPYSTIGLYTISLTFASSGQVFQQTVNVTDCKSIY